MPMKIPSVDITVNGGGLLPATMTDVRAVTVETDIDALSMFTIEIDNWDGTAVTWSEAGIFTVGAVVTISLGYVGGLVKRVLTAEVTSLEGSFSSNEWPSLVVRGHDRRHRMTRGRRTRTFTNVSDGDIVSQVARDYGLRTSVKQTGQTHELVVQSNQSDLEFLRGRARRLGYDLYLLDGVLYFRPPEDARPGPTVDAVFDLQSFTPRLRALGQAGAAQVRGWDAATKAPILGSAAKAQFPGSGGRAADTAFGAATMTTVDSPVASQAEADLLARGSYAGLGAQFLQAEGESEGRTDLQIGKPIKVTGIGSTFGGTYYLTSVSHYLNGTSTFTTSFGARRRVTDAR